MKRIDVAVKLMLDVFYWFMRDSDKSFDYPFNGGWAHMTDEDIISNFGLLTGFINKPNIAVVVHSEMFYNACDAGVIFNRHNGIITRKFDKSWPYRYMATTEDTFSKNIYAVIIDHDLTFKTHEHRGDSVKKASCDESGLHLRSLPDGAFMYVISGFVSALNACAYLCDDYGEHVKQDGVEMIPDRVLGDGNDVVNGKFNNITRILQNKGTVADRYEILVNILNGIDDKLASNINKQIGDYYRQKDRKSTTPIDRAIAFMNDNNIKPSGNLT